MKKLLSISILIYSPLVLAQYAGTIGDLNTIYNPPANIAEIICASTNNNPGPGGHGYRACSNGVAAARYMAEKYAAGAGKYLGCIDGIYQGIQDGYENFKKPSQQMWQQAQEMIKSATFATATSRAEKQAVSESKTESADQIINRYRQVLGVKDSNGNPVLPDKSYHYPPIQFQGYTDGYEYDLTNGHIGSMNFSGPMNAGWINASTPFELKVAAAKAFEIRNQYADVCDNKSTIFGRKNMRQLTIWDYFHQMDENFFKDYGWNNGNWTWDFFINEERNLDLYQTYIGIENLTKKITVQVPITQKQERFKRDANGNLIPKKDANGNPILDSNGNPVYETEIVEVVVGYRNEEKTVQLDANDVATLRALYKKAFIDAYNFHFARAYASLYYNTTGMEKYKTGLLIGQIIGEEVARYQAFKAAYNNIYQQNSLKAYTQKFYKLYETSFNRLIRIFETNPVIDLEDAILYGSFNDNIFRAGEELFATYRLANLGEVSRPITLSLLSSADVRANPSGFVLMPPVLERMSGQTPILGKIADNIMARETIQATLLMNNPGDLQEVKSSLRTTKKQSILVREYAEIQSIQPSVDVLSGTLTVGVNLINPSSLNEDQQLAFPEVEVTIDNSNTVLNKTVEKIPAGKTLPVSITTDELDPLQIINSGRISGKVNVKLANRVVHTQSFSVSVDAAPKALIANYFNKLVLGKVKNTGSQTREERIQTLIQIINAYVDDVLLNDKIRWRRQSHVERTIIADLQRAYAISAASGEMNPEGQKHYTNLALLLAKKVNNKGRTRIRGLDKFYLRALKQFAPTISTRWRDYKDR
jgi:hypothetical protein